MAAPVQVYPHGSTDSLPFATMGSGSLNAMAMFEANYRDDMEKTEAMDLVSRAIQFGELILLGLYSSLQSIHQIAMRSCCLCTADYAGRCCRHLQ